MGGADCMDSTCWRREDIVFQSGVKSGVKSLIESGAVELCAVCD